MKTTAICLSAGTGKRMGSTMPKQYMPLKGKPVIYYSLKAMQDSFIDEIILVCGKDDIEYCEKEIVEKYNITKVTKIVPGGKERYHSVLEGLRSSSGEYIFIHDGARPLLDEKILENAYKCVKEHKACIAAVPVKDTIKIVNSQGYVSETPRRDTVYQVQTPQTFEASIIKRAYEDMALKEMELIEAGVQITDDAMIVELLTGTKVYISEGAYTNIKITTPEDLVLAESLLGN